MIVASVSNKALRSCPVLRSRDNVCLRYAEKANHRTHFDDEILRVAPDGQETIKNSAQGGSTLFTTFEITKSAFYPFRFLWLDVKVPTGRGDVITILPSHQQPVCI